MRRLIGRRLQVLEQNDFALLEGIGGECARAITFLDSGQALPSSNTGNDVQWLSVQAVVALLDERPGRPMLATEEGLRLVLAGAQYKLPVVSDGGCIGLPLNGTPSSDILKPAISAVEDSPVNEGFCMTLAEAVQLGPTKANVHQVAGRAFLLVERYDRLSNAQGHRQRLHQEDFCQALSVVP